MESKIPPKLNIGDLIDGGEVILIAQQQYPDLIDLAYSMLSIVQRNTFAKLELFNIGNSGKKLCGPNIVIPFLLINRCPRKHQIIWRM